MTIEVPDLEFGSRKLSSMEARLDFAIGLYTGHHLSMGKAAKMAGISYPAFLHELGRREICVNYSDDDLTHDLKMIEAVEGQRRHDSR